MTPSNDNRRKFDRVKFAIPLKIELDIDGKIVELPGSSKNLSLKGIYIDTPRRFKPGTPCSVKLQLSGSSEKIELIMQASIARKTGEGMGISFESMDVDTFTHLNNILRYNTTEDDN